MAMRAHTLRTVRTADTNNFSDEPLYEDDDGQEYYDPEVLEGDEEGEGAGFRNGEDDMDIVVSGDPSAAANQKNGGQTGGRVNNVKSHKDKKIPNELRTTTPFMTKYERARILGTRALQIRCVPRLPKMTILYIPLNRTA